MKKQLLFAAIAFSAALLVSCKNNPLDPGTDDPTKPTDQTTLTVTPHELALVLGDQPVSLTATLTPAVAGATIEWSSSNPSVATVTNRGYVQATDYGDCYIYAKYGDLKDSCAVHVKTFMESVLFNSAIVWSEDTMYYTDDAGEPIIRDVTATDGTQYRCYIAQATLYVFSDGFYINNSGRFDGSKEGVILEMEAPMLYATAYLNGTDRGTIFCLGEWQVTDTAGNWLKMCLPGELDEVEYIAQMKNFVAAFNADPEDASYVTYLQAAAKAVKNPTLNTYEYKSGDDGSGGYSYSYIPEAICNSAYISLNGNFPASQYMCGMDFAKVVYQQFAADTTFGANWGLNLGYNAETDQVYFNDEKVHFNPVTTSSYGEIPGEEASEAPQYKPIQVPVISEDPELKARIVEQMQKNPNIKLVRKF